MRASTLSIGILFFLTSVPQSAFANGPGGDWEGNGGTVVECPVRNSPIPALRSFDRLTGIRFFSNDQYGLHFTHAMGWENRIQEIATRIRRSSPQTAMDFLEFVGHFQSNAVPVDPTLIPPFGGLHDRALCTFDPETDTHRLPTHGTPVYTVIHRVPDPLGGPASFYVDSERLHRLQAESPEDYAWLLVHEWLWTFTTQFDLNVIANSTLQADDYLPPAPSNLMDLLNRAFPFFR